jgi:hypothetical protein
LTDVDKNTAPDRDEFWNKRVGPFYERSGALATTELPATAFEGRVDAGEILEVMTSDGAQLYPSFQFGPHGELLPGLRDLIGILLPFSDDLWDVAAWLATPTDRFGGRSAAEALRVGEIDSVLKFARRDIGMWSA